MFTLKKIFLLITIINSSLSGSNIQLNRNLSYKALLASQFGSDSVSAHTKQEMQKIADQHKIGKITIKQPLDALKSNPAFLYIRYRGDTFFLNEEWLNKLPAGERNFALTTHIIRKPLFDTIAHTRLGLIASVFIGGALVSKKYKIGTRLSMGTAAAILVDYVAQASFYKFWKNNAKKQADMLAVKECGSSQDAINFLARLEQYSQNPSRIVQLKERSQALKKIQH
jgi:hypothetical protein